MLTLSSSAYTYANFETVVAAIKDIDRWPDWDKNIKSSHLEEQLNSKSTYSLKLMDGKELTVKVLAVQEVDPQKIVPEKIHHFENSFQLRDEINFGNYIVETIRETMGISRKRTKENFGSVIIKTINIVLKDDRFAAQIAEKVLPEFRKITIASTDNLAEYLNLKCTGQNSKEEEILESKFEGQSEVKSKEERVIDENLPELPPASFTVISSAFTMANFDTVVDAIKNLNKWPDWDPNLESCQIDGELKTNATYKMKLKANGLIQEPLHMKVEEIIKGNPFRPFELKDRTEFEYLSVETIHQVKGLTLKDFGSIITKIMNVTLRENNKNVSAYVKEFLPILKKIVPESVNGLSKFLDQK